MEHRLRRCQLPTLDPRSIEELGRRSFLYRVDRSPWGLTPKRWKATRVVPGRAGVDRWTAHQTPQSFGFDRGPLGTHPTQQVQVMTIWNSRDVGLVVTVVTLPILVVILSVATTLIE